MGLVDRPSLQAAVRARVGSEMAEPSSREGTLNLFSKGPENKYFRICGPHMAPVTYSSLFLKQPFKNINTILSLQAVGWFGLWAAVCQFLLLCHHCWLSAFFINSGFNEFPL